MWLEVFASLIWVQRVLIWWAGASQLRVRGKSKDSVSGIVSDLFVCEMDRLHIDLMIETVIFLEQMCFKETGETRLKVKAVQIHLHPCGWWSDILQDLTKWVKQWMTSCSFCLNTSNYRHHKPGRISVVSCWRVQVPLPDVHSSKGYAPWETWGTITISI